MWSRIMDLIVKTLLGVELLVKHMWSCYFCSEGGVFQGSGFSQVRAVFSLSRGEVASPPLFWGMRPRQGPLPFVSEIAK